MDGQIQTLKKKLASLCLSLCLRLKCAYFVLCCSFPFAVPLSLPESSLCFSFFCLASSASACYSVNCVWFQALEGLPYLPEFANSVYNAYRSIGARRV